MSNTHNIRIQLTIDGHDIEAAVPLPVAPSPRRVLLPILQNLTNTIVDLAIATATGEGRSLSCTKGCDACCVQMVPISPTEAHAISQLFDTLDPAFAQRILSRFDAAVTQLDKLKILDLLLNRHALTADQLKQLDRAYFAAKVPCPFLEDHACSIHKDRPLACREFIVSSNPKYCANPASGKVRQIELPTKVSLALATTDAQPWLPLILARHFTAQHKEPTPKETPQQLLNQILSAL